MVMGGCFWAAARCGRASPAAEANRTTRAPMSARRSLDARRVRMPSPPCRDELGCIPWHHSYHRGGNPSTARGCDKAGPEGGPSNTCTLFRTLKETLYSVETKDANFWLSPRLLGACCLGLSHKRR